MQAILVYGRKTWAIKDEDTRRLKRSVYWMRRWMCSVYFFSSRRRHTICIGDWSSDVCSSDLAGGVFGHITKEDMDGCGIGQYSLSDPDGIVLDLSEREASRAAYSSEGLHA